MQKNYFEDKNYDKLDFTTTLLQSGEYENCTFNNCNFSSSNLSNFVFSECNFIACNLSSAKITKTSFKNTSFKDCKLLGLHFETCNEFLFAVNFDKCNLNLSSFYKVKLKNTTFKNCTLHETDFTEAEASSLVFLNCDFLRAIFHNTNIEKSNFCSSYNYAINPEINKVKKAKFSLNGVIGLLEHLDITII